MTGINATDSQNSSSMTPALTRGEVIERILASHNRVRQQMFVMEQRVKFQDTLSTYSDECIFGIDSMPMKTNIQEAIHSDIYQLMEGGAPEVLIWTYLYFMNSNEYQRIFVEGHRLGFSPLDAVRSLKHYPIVPEVSNTYYAKALALSAVVSDISHQLDESTDDDTKLASFLKYTYALAHEHAYEETSLKNASLVELICEQPNQWESISKVVVQRNTDDVDLIREILTTGAKALSEGTL